MPNTLMLYDLYVPLIPIYDAHHAPLYVSCVLSDLLNMEKFLQKLLFKL